MGSVCILTDTSAQFPQLAFPGRNLVRVLGLDVSLNGILFEDGKEIKANSLPFTANATLNPKVSAPTPDKLYALLNSLSQSYDDIIAILLSAQLSNVYASVARAADEVKGRIRVQMIDSQTTSVGLGILVQIAAEAAAAGIHPVEIERLVRSMIPHIYMVVCTPGLSYLSYAGYIDHAQATLGEMLNLLPIFTLEEGHLTPLEKVRNHRNMLDFFTEFLDEFDAIQHIAFLQSVQPSQADSRLLREHAEDFFEQTPFSEHTINLPLATLLGPRTQGLIVVENPDPRANRSGGLRA
ncbi:MAG TPA: DegV family protein [Anaerolineaceae bacterium]